MRLLAGLVPQPLLAAVVAFVIFPLTIGPEGHSPTRGSDAAFSVAGGTGIVAFFVTLIVVFPTAVWLLKRRAVSFLEALLLGVGIGNLPLLLGTVLVGIRHGTTVAPGAFVFASVIGAVCGAAFWLITIRGRDFSRDQELGRQTGASVGS